MKKRIFIICIISFIVGLIIYINPLLIYRNHKILKHLDSISIKKQITPKELIPFDYDKVYIVYPYTTKKDIGAYLGIKSRYIKENHNDNYQTILVIKNNRVISSTNVSLSYNFQPLAEYKMISKDRDTIIRIVKSDEITSFIEQKKYYEENIYDISFTLPGSYYKEDNEDIRMYYLDIDTSEYLTIEKTDNFNLKKYIKNKDITSQTEQIINNNKTYYLEINNNNTTDLIYIIDINDTYYIFSLNSTKKNTEINKGDLYNIVLSVKNI